MTERRRGESMGLGCFAGSIVFVEFAAAGPAGGMGPDFADVDFTLTTVTEGKWVTFSMTGTYQKKLSFDMDVRLRGGPWVWTQCRRRMGGWRDCAGKTAPPMYSQLLFLLAESTAECEPGTLGLASVDVSGPGSISIPFCGPLDVPCFVVSG